MDYTTKVLIGNAGSWNNFRSHGKGSTMVGFYDQSLLGDFDRKSLRNLRHETLEVSCKTVVMAVDYIWDKETPRCGVMVGDDFRGRDAYFTEFLIKKGTVVTTNLLVAIKSSHPNNFTSMTEEVKGLLLLVGGGVNLDAYIVAA